MHKRMTAARRLSPTCKATLRHDLKATHCNTLQHTATLPCVMTRKPANCSTSGAHATTHCNTLKHTAIHWNTRQHTATQTHSTASRLQHQPGQCHNTLQHTAAHWHTTQPADCGWRENLTQVTSTMKPGQDSMFGFSSVKRITLREGLY